MKISDKGIEFIKREEGEVLTSYRCSAGVWTIGVGHTGKDVTSNMRITKQKSDELLKSDLRRFENCINENVRVELKQREFDALVSLAFNIGCNAFKNSTLLRKINEKATFEEIEKSWKMWRMSNGKINNILVKRRERELEQYKQEETK